jgi:CheY-like chemotaxis protein
VAQLLGTVFPAHAQLRLDNVQRGLPTIEGDEAQIRQVVASLITNAVEALGDEPGTVTVSTGTVDADAAYLRAFKPADELVEGRFAFVEVADTGRGIGPEAQSRIFEPFFTTKFTGRGLGLAALLGIVRGHGGGVRVQSDVGSGAVFTAIFPLAAATRPDSPPPDQGERVTSGGIVLVADDDRIVREVTAQMIERAGFNVVTTTNGDEALEIFRRRSSEVLAVVLDLVMPGRSGEDVLAEIHGVRPDVPVLMCSGYSKLEGEVGSDNDLVCFIAKPYTNDVLIGKLQELLARAVH